MAPCGAAVTPGINLSGSGTLGSRAGARGQEGLLCDKPSVATNSRGQPSNPTADPRPVVSAQGGDTLCVRWPGSEHKTPLKLRGLTLRLSIRPPAAAHRRNRNNFQTPPHHPGPHEAVALFSGRDPSLLSSQNKCPVAPASPPPGPHGAVAQDKHSSVGLVSGLWFRPSPARCFRVGCCQGSQG